MKNKLTIIIAICVSIALVGGLFFWVSSTNTQNKYTYDYQVSKQALSAEKRLKSPDKGQIDIYIAFKKTCPVCQKQEKAITEATEKLPQNVNVTYIDITDGLPKYLSAAFPEGTYEGAKTPYVVVTDNTIDDNGKLHLIYTGRLSNDTNIEKFNAAIKNTQ